jgi:hypothetical protein
LGLFLVTGQEENTENVRNLEAWIGTFMKKIVIFGLSLTLALNIIARIAVAQVPGAIRGYGIDAAIPNLTGDQISKIQALQQAHQKKVQPLWKS